MLIAIAGCSGSGKTVLANALAAHFGGSPVVALDSYYHPLPHLSVEERALVNFDHPEALDWPLLETHLEALLRGQRAEIPIYLFDQHTRAEETAREQTEGLVIVEGIHALHREEVRALASLRIFVETAEQECFRRRLDRDVRERGRTPESVHAQHHLTVWPMAREYVLPSRAHADIVVSGEQSLAESVAAVLSKLGLR